MLKVLILCSFFRIPEKLVRVSDVTDKNTQKTNYEVFFTKVLLLEPLFPMKHFLGCGVGSFKFTRPIQMYVHAMVKTNLS